MSVFVEQQGEVKRVTIYEEGSWLLQMNDVNGTCRHVACYDSVSYYVYKDEDEDEDRFEYFIRPQINFWASKCLLAYCLI